MAGNFADTLTQASGFPYNGQDYSTFLADGSSDLTFDVIVDPKIVVSQHILRRWILEQGQLDIPWIGAGIRRYLNASLSQASRYQLEAELRKHALDVDGVAACDLQSVATPIIGGGISLTVTATITLTVKYGGQTFDTVFVLTPTTAQVIVDGQVT